MSEDTNTQETAPAEAPKPTSIQELVSSIDLTNVSTHEIIVDLIGGIQQLAIRGQIALGLLERLNASDVAEEATPEVTEPSEA
jgi:hypothetical protein